MLTFYHRLAQRLLRYRPVLWLLCIGAVAASLAAVFAVPGADGGRYTFGAIALLMWAVCLLTVSYGFTAPPPAAEPGSRLFARMGVRIRRGLLWLMALLMTALSILVAFVTLRAVGVWVR